MRKKLLTGFGCLYAFVGLAQNDCTKAVVDAKMYILDKTHTKSDYAEAYANMQDCVSQGDTLASYLSGYMLLNGLGVEKDEKLAFQYMIRAAIHDNATAEYYIGVFYMKGTGCDIDFGRGAYWLSRASLHGNQEAIYLMGYNYLKGFGVPQSYEAALSWFGISTDPMAKYWLGNCYYFGYGVSKDTQKAIEYYNQSNTPASKQLLKHIAEQAKEKADVAINKQLKETETPQNTGIVQEVVENLTIEAPRRQIRRLNLKDKLVNEKLDIDGKLKDQQVHGKTLKPKYLNGKWKGKLIELEWSGKEITQILPVSCAFAAKDNNKVNYTWEINKTKSQATALWEDNVLYFDHLNMVFDWPFSDDANIKTIDWQVLSTEVEFKIINKKTYLIGNLETYNPLLKEPGPPMRVILRQTEEGEEDELIDAELLALSQQEEHFIVLYPNPFVSNVLIAYNLEAEAQVSVTLYDLNGNPVPVSLELGALQTAGNHQYTLDGTNLKPGMYIVRVTVNEQTHSRIVIKQ